MRGWDKHIVYNEVMAAGAAHTHHRPGIHNSRLTCWDQHRPGLRHTGGGLPRSVPIHDSTRAEEPVGMMNTTRKVPAALDAIPTVDQIGLAFRP